MIEPAGIVVGVAELAVGAAPAQRITTFALGSCIGVTVWDPVPRVGGLLHFMLPEPSLEALAADELRTAMFATTGVPALFERLGSLGLDRSRAVVCVAGGAEVLGDTAPFAIGRRNRTMLRKIFWKDGTLVAAEDTGGTWARTMTLALADGEVRVRTKDGERVLWGPRVGGVRA